MKSILRAPELWLTPLIGLPPLVYYIHHHGMALYGSWIIAALAGIPLLLATGSIQSLIRLPKWPAWAKVAAGCIVGCVVGGLLVGYVYYYALMPPHLLDNLNGVISEGRGNDIALYYDQSSAFAVIGAVAAVLSCLLAALISLVWPRTSR